jgi:hypothetical protein
MNKELFVRTHTNKTDKLTYPFFFCGILVPKGFVTDYASSGRIGGLLIPKIGKSRKPSVIHDYLYAKDSKYNYTRKEADKIFYEALKVVDMGLFRRSIAYSAVRLFGFLRYKKK